LFRIPIILEVVGAGFDQPANAGYTLRFPRVLKIHGDRSLKDTIGFVELQEMAKRCIAAPDDGEWEEERWYSRLGDNNLGLNNGAEVVAQKEIGGATGPGRPSSASVAEAEGTVEE
jgi:hypothetical protein